MILVELVTTLSIFAVFYAYLGYPLLLSLIVSMREPRSRLSQLTTQNEPHKMAIIIACRNEARVLEEKLKNTLALVGSEVGADRATRQIIVASDASDDGTDEIAKRYASQGVQLVRLNERGGKEQAQQEALKCTDAEIIVFTDAKVRLEQDALQKLTQYFSVSDVGAISTVDIVENGTGGSGEGAYVKYEMWLRQLESDFNSLVGLSGSCFAVRREFVAALRTDLPSDFALLLAIIKAGKRGCHAPDIRCYYSSVATAEEEFGRKVRTALRGITTLMSTREVMSPWRYGSFAWQVISHKLFRWMVPIFAVVAGLGSILLAPYSRVFAMLLFAELLLCLLAAVGYLAPQTRRSNAFKIPLFFMASNLAIAKAWFRYLKGVRETTWTPSGKSVGK